DDGGGSENHRVKGTHRSSPGWARGGAFPRCVPGACVVYKYPNSLVFVAMGECLTGHRTREPHVPPWPARCLTCVGHHGSPAARASLYSGLSSPCEALAFSRSSSPASRAIGTRAQATSRRTQRGGTCSSFPAAPGSCLAAASEGRAP